MSSDQSPTSPQAAPQPQAKNGNGGHPHELAFPLVLVVDDHEHDLGAMDELLRRHGFRSEPVRTYAEAAHLVRTRRYAAVVADFRLGGDHDGLDLLRLAQEHAPHAARILVTADPMGGVLADTVRGVWISKDHDYAIALVRAIREGIEGGQP